MQEASLNKEAHQSLVEEKYRQLAAFEGELEAIENELARSRHLYTVKIPDDNGSNYLHWDQPLTEDQKRKLVLQGVLEGVAFDFYGDAMNAHA